MVTLHTIQACVGELFYFSLTPGFLVVNLNYVAVFHMMILQFNTGETGKSATVAFSVH